MQTKVYIIYNELNRVPPLPFGLIYIKWLCHMSQWKLATLLYHGDQKTPIHTPTERQNDMTQIKTILIGTDLSTEAEHIIKQGLVLAQTFDASLQLLHVIDDHVSLYQDVLPLSPPELEEMLIQETKRKLYEMYGNTGEASFEAHVKFGKPYKVLLEYAAEIKADLILAGPRNPSFLKRLFLGSTATMLLHENPVNTMLLPPNVELPLNKILVPVDFSETSTKALEEAQTWAKIAGAEVHVLHVLEETPVASMVGVLPLAELSGFQAMYAEKMKETFGTFIENNPIEGIDVSTHFAQGDAAHEIVSYAKANDIDLIVMGTVGRSGLEGIMLGNTAERVAREQPCALLTVRGKAKS